MDYYCHGEVLQFLNEHIPGDMGYAFEAGACDGKHLSATYHLEKTYNWRVICAEANPLYYPELRRNRDRVAECAVGSFEGDCDFDYRGMPGSDVSGGSALRIVGTTPQEQREGWTQLTVPVRKIDSLLEEFKFPRLDFICLDIEGSELDALHGLNIPKWEIKVLMLENNAADNGDADTRVRDYLSQFGYAYKFRSENNEFFLRT